MSTVSITTTALHLGEQRVRLLEAGRQGAPDVLLIHGGLGDAELHWSHTLTTLGASFHVYAPDLPGFHDDSDPLKQPSLPHLMNWMHDLLGALSLKKVFLLGTSVGGLLSRFFAAKYPALVERLILVDGGAIATIPGIVRALINAPGISQAFSGFTAHRIYSRSRLQRSIAQHHLLTEDFFQRLQRARIGYMPLFQAMLAEPWPADQTPTCPTLVIWGKEDHLAPLDEGRSVLRDIVQAQLVLIEGAGHMPMLEQPDVFTTAVSAFLQK